MSFNPEQFRALIVVPTLDLCTDLAHVPNPPFAADLLIATCAQESALGHYLHQTGHGPAVSIYQIEPASLHDLWRNFVEPAKDNDGLPRFRNLIHATILGTEPLEDEIIWNLRAATVAARLFYLRTPEPFPAGTDYTVADLWHTYKKYYNTELGAATEDSFNEALTKYSDIEA